MADLERAYNVPLRKEWLKVQRYKRTQRAVKALKQFMVRHMKSEDVKIGPYLNEHMWKHGIKNPPHHVKVNAHKFEDGRVHVELEGKEMFARVEKGEEKEKSKIEEKLEGLVGKKESAKPSAKKEAKQKAAEKQAEKSAVKKEEAPVKKAEEKSAPKQGEKPAPKKEPAKVKKEEPMVEQMPRPEEKQ